MQNTKEEEVIFLLMERGRGNRGRVTKTQWGEKKKKQLIIIEKKIGFFCHAKGKVRN